jgi:hypothetical protein
VLLAAVGCALVACSNGDDGTADTTTSTTTATTVEAPVFTGDPDSAFCSRLREIDPNTVLAGTPGDPAEVEVAFRELVRTLRDLGALAPTEVEADAALVVDGIEALDAALAAVGYDFDALATSSAAAEVTAAVNDPAFTAAGDRLTAYRTQVCRL